MLAILLSNAHLGVNQVAGSVEEKSVVIEQSIKAGDEIDEGSTLNLTTEFKEDKKKSEKKEESSSNKNNWYCRRYCTIWF